jgi:hypothetical protein
MFFFQFLLTEFYLNLQLFSDMNLLMHYLHRMASKTKPLAFQVLAECSSSKARTSLLELPHHTVETPVFMPVGTQVCII